MAAATRRNSLKTTADLNIWLRDEVSPKLSGETEAIAHGGTALALLGLKESTKDVDFSFRTKKDFDSFVASLEVLGYKSTMDFRARKGEIFLRLENPAYVIDTIDLRFPTWNNWHITEKILKRALFLMLGRVKLVRLDADTVFLFKTYPMRDTDIADLRDILNLKKLDESRVIELFDEQDKIYGQELMAEDIQYEPLFKIVELRTRFAGSLSLLGAKYRGVIPRISKHADVRFKELSLGLPLKDIVALLRKVDRPVDWDKILGPSMEKLRQRLATVDEQ